MDITAFVKSIRSALDTDALEDPEKLNVIDCFVEAAEQELGIDVLTEEAI